MSNLKQITFVCCPKPFIKEFYDIQNNAFISWTKLKSVKRIVICGDDEGVKEYADKLKALMQTQNTDKEIIYHPKLKKNQYGTPLVSDIFRLGVQLTPEDMNMCYINCDIILLNDFDETYAKFSELNKKDFLLIGRRWDWRIPESIDFNESGWEDKVKEKAINNGKLHQDTGIDYFVYSKTTFPFIYDFAVGKFIWDQWLVGNAYRRNIITINATNTIFAIHQDSPWFQYGKIQQKSRAVQNTPEYRTNNSFDQFRKTINQGTKWESQREGDSIIIKKK